MDGVEIGYPQGVKNQAPNRRTPSWPHRHTGLPCVVNDVFHDQEVTGEARLADDVKLMLKTLRVYFFLHRTLLAAARGSEFPQIGHRRVELLGDRVARQFEVAGVEIDVHHAALGDLDRVFKSFR
ncbi:hypothetical protein ES703_04578 [subsurface metagenome]